MYTILTKQRSNSRQYKKEVFKTEDMQEIKNFLDTNKLSVLSKPYFFTHIDLSNNHIITSTNTTYNIMTSPEDLYNFLTK